LISPYGSNLPWDVDDAAAADLTVGAAAAVVVVVIASAAADGIDDEWPGLAPLAVAALALVLDGIDDA
jgi:hypothetical protein